MVLPPPTDSLALARLREHLRALGFRLGLRAQAGESLLGAWHATDPQGSPVVLKWFPDEAVADRYALLLPALEQLRGRGVPIPEYPHILNLDGWTVSAQQLLPGSSRDNPTPGMVTEVVACVAAQVGIPCPLPLPDHLPWGESVVHTLTLGADEWGPHAPLATGGARSAELLERIRAVGAGADPTWFRNRGLIHLDLHTDNLLAAEDGRLSGIIDWEGACSGDPDFDLVRFAFDLDGHDQPIWEVVEATGIEERALRAYLAHHSLRCTSWALRFRQADVPRQLTRAERCLERYGA